MIDIISYSAAESPVGKLAAILDRRDGQPADVEAAVQEILRQVRASGDDAVVEYTSRFDGVTMTPQSMRVSAKALAPIAARAKRDAIRIRIMVDGLRLNLL